MATTHYVLPATHCVPMRSRSEGSRQVCACDRSVADQASRSPLHQPRHLRHPLPSQPRPSHPPPLAEAGAAGVGCVLEPRTQRESPTHATLTREAPSRATMAVVPGGDNKVTWGHGLAASGDGGGACGNGQPALLFQRKSRPQAAPCFGQPRAISQSAAAWAALTPRPRRACLRHGGGTK